MLRVTAAAAAATVGLFLASVGPALADDHVAVFAGGQADFSNYVFFGATAALPGATIGNGLAVRGLVDTGGYDYMNATLGTVKASFGGGELDLLYQFSQKNFWGDFGVGGNDTYTALVPDDLSNRRRGQQAEVRLSIDGGGMSGPWRTDVTGYYGVRLNDYAGRIGLTHALSSQWRLGAEFYAEGDPTYNLRQVGPYAAVKIGPTEELSFSTGASWETGPTPRAYLRALIYQSF
ncbi:MAG: cellulose biosynthesis protein BcsS [Candidatus Eremiobacteraeota bacterium]|nr:cellulose biosynthesis protein BcsS [Candidatus Eremiobacteraeota bacterium]